MIIRKKKLIKNLVSKNINCKEALKLIDRLPNKFLIFLNKEQKILATLTDGDIRRGFLKGFKISDKAFLFANKNPKILPIKKFKDNNIRNDINFIPLTKKKKFFAIWISGIKKKNIKAKDELNSIPFIIMAGGEGKRMGNLTRLKPKPMIKLGNKYILQHIVDNAYKNNFNNLFILTYFKANKIFSFFEKKKNYRDKITLIKEKNPLGTFGGVLMYKKFFKKFDKIIVHNGDIITNLDYNKIINFHEERNSSITLTVKENTTKSPHGEINLSNNRIGKIIEKPTKSYFYSSGIYVIKTKLLNYLKPVNKNKMDMPEFINFMIKKKFKVLAFPIYEASKEFTFPEDLD